MTPTLSPLHLLAELDYCASLLTATADHLDRAGHWPDRPDDITTDLRAWALVLRAHITTLQGRPPA